MSQLNLEQHKLVLRLLALTFRPASRDGLCSGLSSATGLPQYKITSELKELSSGGVLTEEEDRRFRYYSSYADYWMETGVRLNTILDIRENCTDSEKKKLLKHAESLNSSRWDEATSETLVLRNRLASALVYNSRIGAIPRTHGDYATLESPARSLFLHLLETPKSRKGFGSVLESLPMDVISGLCSYTLADAVSGDWNIHYDEFAGIVKSDDALSPEEKSFMLEKLSLLLKTLRDDFTDLGFDISAPVTFHGFLTAAVKAFVDKDWAGAEKLFRQAAKKRDEGGLTGFLLFDLMFAAALKQSGGKMAAKTLEAIIRKEPWTRHSEYGAFRLYVNSFDGRKTDPNLVVRVMSDIPVLNLMDSYASYMVLDTMGLLEGASDRVGEVGETLKSDKDYALINRPGLLPFEKKEQWEWAIENLSTKLGYGSASAAGVKDVPAAATAKVVYMLSRNLSNLQPVLRKSKDGVRWTGGRNIALSTFSSGIPEMSDLDKSIAREVTLHEGGWSSGRYYTLNGKSVISSLVGHKDVYLLENPDIRIDIVREDPYLATVKRRGGTGFKSNVDDAEMCGDCAVVKETDSLIKVIGLSRRQRDIISGLDGIVFPSEAEERLRKFISLLSKDIVVHTDLLKEGSECRKVAGDSRITVVLQPSGEGMRVEFYVKPFVTVSPYLSPGKGSRSVITRIDSEAVQTERDLKLESANLDKVRDSLGDFFDDNRDGAWICSDLTSSLDVLDTLRLMGDEVRTEWPEGCKLKIKGSCDISDVHLQLKSRTNWFEVGGTMEVSEGQVLQMAQVLQMLSGSQGRFICIGEGEFLALTTRLRQQLDSLGAVSTQSGEDRLRIPGVALPVVGELASEGVDVKQDAASKRMLKTIKEASDKSFSVPEGLKAELRSYQEDGYRWMCRLASWGAGACLADDMGLGKTVQAIALMLHRAEDGPALVVAPASVVSNWEKELVRFAPSLSVSLLNGMDSAARAEAVSAASGYDVILTTYGVLVAEQQLLSSREWSTMILDEAHIIKNKDTKSSAACMAVKAGFRAILTGTPLQNHLGEIWNLFQFINPGYLGTFAQFSDKYLVPIQENGDKAAQARLKKLLLPFMLRRTKTDVLDELPEKTEQTILVDLSDPEKAVYESLRRNAELMLEEHQANLVQTLAEILKLRQAACCPALVQKGLQRSSSKVDELLAMVDKIVSGGHKALVFSQFTSFLSIIREALDKAGVKYEYLDGSTPVGRRPAIVKAFQTGSAPLFLISLKAGGLGLNLTSADYIIHTDPWWNPSVEDQASDRAYRIGQTRPVTIYRLIAKDTIEEKILDLHKDKRSLADSLLEGADMSSKLTRDDLLKIIGS